MIKRKFKEGILVQTQDGEKLEIRLEMVKNKAALLSFKSDREKFKIKRFELVDGLSNRDNEYHIS